MFKRLIGLMKGQPAPKPAQPEREPLRSIADIEALIVELGLEAARDFILGCARPCTFYIAVKDGGDAGAQFGGLPKLGDVAWPVDAEGQALGFIAQVDLADRRLAFFYGPGPQGGTVEHGHVVVTPAGASQVTQPPRGAFKTFERDRLFKAAAVRAEAGLCLPSDMAFSDHVRLLVTGAAPGEPHPFDHVLDDLAEAARAQPAGTIAQAMGHPLDVGQGVLEQVALGALKRPGLERLLQWTSWEAWEQAKTMSSQLRNGTIYRPWRDEHDGDMRWVLENRSLIEAEIAAWRLLLSVDSNSAMNFWVNDADPLFFFIREDDLAAGRFDRVLAVATQG